MRCLGDSLLHSNSGKMKIKKELKGSGNRTKDEMEAPEDNDAEKRITSVNKKWKGGRV